MIRLLIYLCVELFQYTPLQHFFAERYRCRNEKTSSKSPQAILRFRRASSLFAFLR